MSQTMLHKYLTSYKSVVLKCQLTKTVVNLIHRFSNACVTQAATSSARLAGFASSVVIT